MGKDITCTALFKLWHVIFSELWIVKYRRLMVLTTKLKFLKVQMTEVSITMLLTQHFKGAVSRNSAKLGNYKMPVKLRET